MTVGSSGVSILSRDYNTVKGGFSPTKLMGLRMRGIGMNPLIEKPG